MSEQDIPHFESTGPIELSERDWALLAKVHRRELIVCAVSAALTSAVVTTVLFFGYVELFGGAAGAS